MTNPYYKRCFRSVSAAAIFAGFASPGLAITPEELWTQWQSYLTSSGYEITATESGSGDSLTVSDIELSMEMPVEDDETAAVTVSLGEYTFSGRGDGSVDVLMPGRQTIAIHVEAPEEDPVDITLVQTATGFSMVASGTAEDTDYTYSADSLGLAMTDLVRGGETVELGTVEVAINGISGTTGIDVAGGRYTVEQTLGASELTYTVDVADPEPDSTGTFTMNGRMEGISSTGGGTVPEGVDLTDMAAAMEAGYAVNATLGYSAGETTLAFRDGAESFDYSSTSEGGSLAFRLDAARLVYQVLGSVVTMNASGAQMPFPVNISAEALGFQIAMPLNETEEAQDFSASLTLSEIALPDQLWAMADPAGGLPRDPLTVEVALSGTGRLFVNLMDQAEMEQLAETGGVPGEVETLTLDNLTIRGVGAEIGATAALQVDNEAMSPFGPGPNVWGTANIRMQGVQGLLNTLSQMGLVPPAQAMMAAGMISQLGRPVSGPDDLEADVELSEQGDLSVNGQPMPLR